MPDPTDATSSAAPPEAIVALARARAAARATRDFGSADRLRAEIEAAGWKVVDRGTDFDLAPAHPPDVADGDRVRYGASTSVPSRLDEPPSVPATVILTATDWPDDLARTLDGLRAHAPAGTQVVIVADDPSARQAEALDVMEASDAMKAPDAIRLTGAEIVWTSTRLGTAAAIDCGVRRALGEIVVRLDTSLEPTGDIVSPLVAALADPDVAVAGGWGIVSDDLRTFRDAATGDVDAITSACQAFRRADFAARGPLDERFRSDRDLDIWWSLVLRDEGVDAPPRRAVRTEPLPIVCHERRGDASLPPGVRDRQIKRDFYRLIDRFGSRRDLLVANRAG